MGRRAIALIGVVGSLLLVVGHADAADSWGEATRAEFAASSPQNTNPNAYFSSVSCASAGNCTAAGVFKNAAGNFEAFTMTSTAGTWGEATRAVFAASSPQNTNPDASFS